MHDTGEAPAPLRDEGALDSALMRPQMAAHYEDADLAAQAALLIAGVAMAHPFVDGNKRTALVCGDVFLQMNGSWLDADDIELAQQVLTVVTHDDSVSSDDATARFVQWLRERLRSI